MSGIDKVEFTVHRGVAGGFLARRARISVDILGLEAN